MFQGIISTHTKTICLNKIKLKFKLNSVFRLNIIDLEQRVF